MYLDGFCKFLVILVKKEKKNILPLSNNFGNNKKIHFWRFLKNAVSTQKPDYLDRFLVEFPKNVNFCIHHLISFQVTTKNIFTKCYKIMRVAFLSCFQHKPLTETAYEI